MSKDKLLEELVSNTRNILRWIRFQNLPSLKNVLEKTLSSPEERSVYESADGETSQGDMASKTGVAQRTISDWLQRWHHLGLVDLVDGKYKKVESLTHMGITIPETKSKSQLKEQAES